MCKANLAVYQKSFGVLFQATLNYLCNSCGGDRISPSPFEDCEDCDEIDYGKKNQAHITNFFFNEDWFNTCNTNIFKMFPFDEIFHTKNCLQNLPQIIASSKKSSPLGADK